MATHSRITKRVRVRYGKTGSDSKVLPNAGKVIAFANMRIGEGYQGRVGPRLYGERIAEVDVVDLVIRADAVPG